MMAASSTERVIGPGVSSVGLSGRGCEPKLWDQAAAFDDASGWLRLAGADGLSASAAQ
jgi:hypothetical protein